MQIRIIYVICSKLFTGIISIFLVFSGVNSSALAVWTQTVAFRRLSHGRHLASIVANVPQEGTLNDVGRGPCDGRTPGACLCSGSLPLGYTLKHLLHLLPTP
ncbi:hypothetical protein B0H10DRAFT_388618 [Mycena sp. CBHHK59/15]|nr:hypothetical protein B0H10DRAFT_388618 [Mycena sp. CBHHK59/15]